MEGLNMSNSVVELIGNTPLLKLERASNETGCAILGKAEFLNPGQSIKDRAALYIIRSAIEAGTLKKGGTIVEGTAGNTGIGLALVAALKLEAIKPFSIAMASSLPVARKTENVDSNDYFHMLLEYIILVLLNSSNANGAAR